MPNRCVSAGCRNMPSDSVSLFRFPKDPNLCGVWTRQVERTRWIGSLARHVDCFPALKQFTALGPYAWHTYSIPITCYVSDIFCRPIPKKKSVCMDRQ